MKRETSRKFRNCQDLPRKGNFYRRLFDYQDALVLENLDLVNWVIRTRISIPNRPLLTYDDFYAIGCEAICRAALKYQPDMGTFAPFACRYIYNAIVDHCRAMNYRLERSVENSEDENASLLDNLLR